MQKILLAIDAINAHKNTLEFANYVARLTRSKITAIFLENTVSEERSFVKSVGEDAYSGPVSSEDINEYLEKSKEIEQNIQYCRDFFANHGVICAIHRDRGVPAREIVEESRFADLLIVDPETSFKSRPEGFPTDFVKDVLAASECPVIIAPTSFEGINEIVFTYNGSKSSVFAIRQFTYVLPQLSNEKVTVLHVNENPGKPTGDRLKFKEWLQNYYSNIHFEELNGPADTELLSFLLKRKNNLIVMGAYGRGMLSQFFKHSHADVLIRTVTQPIFISHY